MKSGVNMREKVINTIEKYNMIERGDRIIVGFSGGPDSVSLLHVLNSIKELYDIKLYAVHINHMIRGDEALRDEEYAKSFAKSLGIPFYIKREGVLEFADKNKMSSEEAGRFIRYSFFDETAKRVGANKIALAHNMNDQAETMIMRFIRGAGIGGLSGIKPVRDGRYIRPIIECSRDEIEEYCRENNLNPVIDSTNKESIYIRNRIRLEVIPYIKKYFNPNIVESLYKTSEVLRDEDEYINYAAAHEYERIRAEKGIYIDKFNLLHIAIKRRIIRELIKTVKGNLNGIESKHVEECIELIKKGVTGKSISLPGDIEGAVQYSIFKIERRIERHGYEYSLPIPGILEINEENIVICTKVIDNNIGIYKDSKFIKYFDYDKIDSGLKIRTRKEGDFIYPDGMTGSKKIKNIFIDKKISRSERDRIPLVAKGNEILWIFGIRDTRNYKVDENTRRILEIKIKRGAAYEWSNKRDTAD